MKLSTKLSISFSTILVFLIIVSVLAWRTANELNNQKDFIAEAEDMITKVAEVKASALSAVVQTNPEMLVQAGTHIETVKEHIVSLKQINSSPAFDAIYKEAEQSVKTLGPIVEKMTQMFADYVGIYAQIGEASQQVNKDLEQIAKQDLEQFNATGIVDDYVLNAEVRSAFHRVRQNISRFLITGTEKDLARAKELMNNLHSLTARLDTSSPLIRDTVSALNKYTEQAERIFICKIELQKCVIEGDKAVLNLQSIGAQLSAAARQSFAETKDNVVFMLTLVSAIAIIVGIILTFAITKNVLKQLGADPSDLSALADRVSAGDYDVDDGKPRRGVYHNIIEMVGKMKEALQFSQNILASLPVPCAVYGPDNRLKFANREMMNLLENPRKMEDCIGQTSGEFMYREENKNTCTLRAITSKQTGKNHQEYVTHKGNKLHIDATAQPLIDRNGNVTDTITIWRDITEQTLQAQKIADAHENMQKIARELEQVATIASSASEQLSAQIELSENGAQDQADRVATTATALEEMNATVLEIARNAGTTSDSASSVRAEATAGSESMQECVKAMVDVREESLKLQAEMSVLSDHAQAINEIMNVISDIADQTNLLALNAAIEAARAGEAGRGFAVVADEVRNLAEKTMTSTTDVGNAISAIQKSTADNTRLVMGAVEKIERVTEMVNHAGDALMGIVQLADTTADQIRAIATASEEQSATSEEITQAVDTINNIAKENANNMQEARHAVNEVVNQTHVLSQLIEQLQA